MNFLFEIPHNKDHVTKHDKPKYVNDLNQRRANQMRVIGNEPKELKRISEMKTTWSSIEEEIKQNGFQVNAKIKTTLDDSENAIAKCVFIWQMRIFSFFFS